MDVRKGMWQPPSKIWHTVTYKRDDVAFLRDYEVVELVCGSFQDKDKNLRSREVTKTLKMKFMAMPYFEFPSHDVFKLVLVATY